MDGACRDAAHAATRQDVVGWRLGWWALPWVRGNGGRGGRLGRRKGCRRGTPAVLGDGEVMTGLGRMRRGRCDERRGPAKLDSTARRDRRHSARRRGSGIDGEVSLVGLRRRRAANDVQIDYAKSWVCSTLSPSSWCSTATWMEGSRTPARYKVVGNGVFLREKRDG